MEVVTVTPFVEKDTPTPEVFLDEDELFNQERKESDAMFDLLGKRKDHPSPSGSVPTSTEVSPARKAARTEDEGAAPEPAPAPTSAPDSGYVSSDGTGTSGGLSRPPLVVRTTSGGINLAGGGGGAQAGVELAMTAVERWNAQRAAAAAAAAGLSDKDRPRRAAGGDVEMSNQ